jgi:TatD DNase family protein
MNFIDTHCHLDGEEFKDDRDIVVQRAREAGCQAIFLPAIDVASCHTVLDTCCQYPGYCYPMLGLHPEEVRADWRDQLLAISQQLKSNSQQPIAIGEVGLDYYWSREFEEEQLQAFEEQVRWAVEQQLPLMIHCRKAQNEMVNLLKRYADDLPGGVFHCFTGNEQEARQLLEFPRFVLGIGGVLTFKKSNLPATLSGTATSQAHLVASQTGAELSRPTVPLDRIVLETDAPYMAPVPMRGQRNEPAFIRHVISRLAEAYGVSEDEVAARTTANVARVFGLK